MGVSTGIHSTTVSGAFEPIGAQPCRKVQATLTRAFGKRTSQQTTTKKLQRFKKNEKKRRNKRKRCDAGLKAHCSTPAPKESPSPPSFEAEKTVCLDFRVLPTARSGGPVVYGARVCNASWEVRTQASFVCEILRPLCSLSSPLRKNEATAHARPVCSGCASAVKLRKRSPWFQSHALLHLGTLQKSDYRRHLSNG